MRRRSSRSSKPKSGHWVYGPNAILELIRAGRRPIKRLFALKTKGEQESPEIQKIINQAKCEVQFCSRDELTNLVDHTHHQGLVAQTVEFPYSHLELKTQPEDQDTILVLDSVSDPQNFATLCRSALAFGITQIVIPKDRSVSVTGTVCKASAGAVEHLQIIQVTNLTRELNEMKEAGYWVYGAALSDKSESLTGLKPATRRVVVLGAEGTGIRRLVAEACDVLFKIPMATNFDSLNVAQAGTVVLWELYKDQRA